MDGDPGPGTPVPTPPPVDTAGIASNVQRAYTASKAAGTPLSDDDLEAYARRESGGKLGLQDLANAHVAATASAPTTAPSATEAAGVHAGDQLTFGLGNKAVAALMHSISGANYDDVRKWQDSRMAAQQAAHPVASLAGSLGGAIANPANFVLPGAGLDAGILKTGANLARGGAIMGGLDAAGHSTGSLADRAQQTATGAGVGAAGGGILGSLGAAVAPAVSGLARVGRSVAQSGGVQTIENTLNRLVGAGRGSEAAMGDLSPQLGGLADQSATRSVDAAAPIAALTGTRQLGQAGRILDDIRKAYPVEPNAPAMSKMMLDSRRVWAAGPEGFGGIRAQNPPVDLEGLAQTLKAPQVQPSLVAAHLAGDMGIKPGDEVDQMLQHVMADNPTWSKAAAQQFSGDGAKALYGSPAGPPKIGYTELKALSEDLARRKDAAYNKGAGGLGENLSTLRDAVEGTLNKVPGHADAMAEYADRSKGIEALKAGEDAYDAEDSRQIAPTLAEYTPDQQDLFRQGLLSKAIVRLRGKTKSEDVANTMTKASDALQDKLAAAFEGSKTTPAEFMQRIAAERTMSGMKGATTGSPSTYRFLGATPTVASLGALGTGGIAAFAGHPVAGMAAALAPHVAQAIEQHTAGKAGQLLATQGAPAIRALLQHIAQPGILGRSLQGAASGIPGAAPTLWDQLR